MTGPLEGFGPIDPEDRPVPLVPEPGDQPPAPNRNPSDVIGSAERLVRAAQEAIEREDTEPSLQVTPSPTAGHQAARSASGRITSRRLKVAALTLATAAAFIHGWHQGATTGRSSTAANEVSVLGFVRTGWK